MGVSRNHRVHSAAGELRNPFDQSGESFSLLEFPVNDEDENIGLVSELLTDIAINFELIREAQIIHVFHGCGLRRQRVV